MDEDEKKKQQEGLEVLLDYSKTQQEIGDKVSIGLVPVVVQDYMSGTILMVAYANQEALETTLETGYATFWSRSRKELWKKGGTSGDRLSVKEILVDCDQDTLVYRVAMEGQGACHTKVDGRARASCFYRRLNADGTGLEFIRETPTGR